LYIATLSAVASVGLSLIAVMAISLHERYRLIAHMFYGNIMIPEIVLAIMLLLFFLWAGLPLGALTLTMAHTVVGLGYAFPLVYQRWLECDTELIEASYDLGATAVQTWRRVIIPFLKPALLTAGLLVFILSFDDFLLAYFCSSPEFQTLPMAFLSMLRVGIPPQFNALATLMLVMACIGVGVHQMFFSRRKS